ncbi:MAG: sulfatase-like hydrolase/transferase [Elusimicrobiota bacterium]
MFWPCVLLAFSLTCVKLSYAPLSVYWEGATMSSALQWLATLSGQDLLFGLGTGLLAFLPKRAFAAFGALCVAYAVVARQVFAYFAAPLTIQMLALAAQEDPALLRAWAAPYATGTAWLFFILAPLLYVLAALGASKLDERAKPAFRQAARLCVVLSCLLWLGLGWLRQPERWFLHRDRLIRENPHWALLKSLPGRRIALSSEGFPDEYLQEFAPPVQGGSYKGKRPRNVVLIVMESVGTRYLSQDLMPRLAAEMRSGLVFENYYCEVPWTTHALASLMRSTRSPLDHYDIARFTLPLAGGTTLAQAFKGRGYRTAFFSSGDPSWATPRFKEESGFDDFAERLPDDKGLFGEAVRWIGRGPGQPFLLVLWTEQTHNSPCRLVEGELMPELPPGIRAGEPEWLRLYLSVLKETDGYLGAFFDELRSRGLADDTLVAVLGDHGEGFRDPHGNAGHGFSVYEEEVHIPLLLWNPRAFRGGGRSSSAGSHVDLGPTLLDVVGLPVPRGWQGRSLFASDRSPRVYLHTPAWGSYLLAVREGDWKYVADAWRGAEELYDLSKDPEEREDLHASEPERCRSLRQRLAAFLRYSRKAKP